MAQTNCFAYILTAYDTKTGILYGFYKGSISVPDTTGSIWYAKFFHSLKTAKSWKEIVEKRSEYAGKFIWKIQKVCMNAPEDVE